jgi:hypothetical protein
MQPKLAGISFKLLKYPVDYCSSIVAATVPLGVSHCAFLSLPQSSTASPPPLLHRQGYKAGVVTPEQRTSSHMISHHSCTSFPMIVELLGGCLSFPFGSMTETSWPASETTQEHLQNLKSQGYMTAAELATYRVLADPATPSPMGGIHHGMHGVL